MISTFIFQVVLINLVVALMSDTYENCINSIDEKNNKELNLLILQLESFMFWNRGEASQ